MIGGMAAMARDLPMPATVDIDITPSRDPENLERPASAFDDLVAWFKPFLWARTVYGGGARPLVIVGSCCPWRRRGISVRISRTWSVLDMFFSFRGGSVALVEQWRPWSDR